MKATVWLFGILTALLLFGCKEAAPDKPKKSPEPAAEKSAPKDEIQANLAKLDPADRKLAEAQVYCAVETDGKLGSMGVPFKVMVKDQPVFVCCKGCQKSALAEPDKTLATVAELKKKSAGK